jgi:hypothetical protein
MEHGFLLLQALGNGSKIVRPAHLARAVCQAFSNIAKAAVFG